jgi:hypothetical protein
MQLRALNQAVKHSLGYTLSTPLKIMEQHQASDNIYDTNWIIYYLRLSENREQSLL